jgi:hypothetical protein
MASMGKTPGLTPLQGLGVLLGVIVAVAALIGIGMALGLSALYGGSLFVLYWIGLHQARPAAFVPALAGALGGLAVSWVLILPGGGMALGLGLVVLAVYAKIMGYLPILVNNALMLFLVLGTIPVLAHAATLAQIARAVVVAAAYTGGLTLLAHRLLARRHALAAGRS